MPDGLVDRLGELVGDMPVQAYANAAGVSNTHLHNLMKGIGANPTYEMYARLVSVRANRGYTVSWLATGRNEDEKPVETLDDFYAWKQRMMRQEKRYLEALMDGATRLADLTPAQERQVEQMQADSAAEEGRLDKSQPVHRSVGQTTAAGRADTAA